MCGFPELSPEVCEFSKELVSKAWGGITWKDGPRQSSEYLCWQSGFTTKEAGGGGGDELQAEEGGAVHTKAQVALTGAACDISMKDAHIRETCAL